MQRIVTFSTAVHGTFTTVGAGLSCELCASRDNFDHRWLALDPKGLPNFGSCVKLRPLFPPGVLSICENALSILSCTTSGIHLVLWPGDQRSWINRKGMTARLSPGLSQCSLRPVPGEGQGGRQVPVANDCTVTYPGSHWGLHCLPCAVKPHPSASELFLLQNYFCFDSSSPPWFPLEAKSSKAESCFQWFCWRLTRSLEDLWGWVFTLRLLV